MSGNDRLAVARKLRYRGIRDGTVLVGPQTVHVDLANGCNTNCTTCWDHSPLLDRPRSIEWKRQFLPVAEFQTLADDLASMESIEAVILSGMGDPFVNPDVYSIIEIAKSKGWHVTVLTNALLADASRVVDLDVDMMLVSVNGVTPASYCAFHPNLAPRDFERLRGLLEYWASRGRRFKHVQVINRDTADDLPEMIRFAHSYSAAHVTFKLASLGNGTERCSITATQRERLVTELVPVARAEAARLGVASNLEVFATQLAAGGLSTAPIAEIGCFMGWFYSRITVDGRILYCCSTEIEVGHLSDRPFSEHWTGVRWTELRHRLMNGDYFSSCSQCGKLNQNVKIGRKVREKYSDELYFERIGRRNGAAPASGRRSLPVISRNGSF